MLGFPRRPRARRTLLFGLLTALPLAVLLPLLPAVSVAAPGPLHVSLAFDSGQLRVVPARAGFSRVGMAGLAHRDMGPGCWPESVVWLAIPDGMAVDRVHVREGGAAPVGSLGRPELDGMRGDLPAVEAGPTVRSAEGWVRGQRLLVVRVSPLAWDEAAGNAVLWSGIDLDVELRPASPEPDILVPRRPDSPGDRRMRDTLRRLVANPEEIAAAPATGRPGPGRGGFEPRSFAEAAWDDLFRPTLDGRPVDQVIITGAALEAEYQRLADWRTRSGHYTVIRTVEWISDNYPQGVDLPDRIRRFIRDAASLWGTDWILLGGDVDLVPVRYGRSQYYGGEDIPADLYYQCLDRNWNENGNDQFGEGSPPGDGSIPADNADLFPEVYLARIPVSTPEGVRHMIDKTFRYERTPSTAPGYTDRFLALGEVLQPPNWNYPDTVVFDGALLCEEAISEMAPGIRTVRMYENYRPFEGLGAVPEIRDAVLDSLDKGFGIVMHAGHGFHNNLSVGIGGQEIFRDDVDAMQNVDRPFLFFGINCNSAAIDFDCIAEHFLGQANGAFGYIGSTRFDFPGSGDAFQSLFLDGIMKGQTLAQAHALAKLAEVPLSLRDGPERWHQMSLLTLGDPLVRIHSEIPRTLAVTHAATLPLGGPVTVGVARAGLPLAGARVTLFRAGEVFATDTTGVDGSVTLDCPAETAGPLSVVVTALNSIPYEASPMLAAPAFQAYPVVTGLSIDDGVSGNGNGRLEAGETADLHFKVRNDGGGPANNLVLTLATGASGVTLVQPTAALGSLASGAVDSTWEGPAIRLTLDTGIAERFDIAATLALAWTGGSRSHPLALHAGGMGLLVLSQSFVDDPGGPGHDGVPAPNERIDLLPVLVNRGAGQAGGVRARLVSTDPRVTLLADDVTLGTLAPGGAAPLPSPLAFRVTELAAIATIDLVLEAQGIEQGRRAVDLTPPPAPGVPRGLSRPNSIQLSWTGVIAADLRGYGIFRSTSEGGPYEQLNAFVDNPMGSYEDIGLPAFTRYFYKVAAMDRSGNLSGFSPVVVYSTSYSSLNNWPVRREGGTPSSPTVHDFDGDGVLEVLIGGEEIYALRADGTEYRNGDADSRTLGVLTQTGRPNYWATPGVADVDGDGILDIVGAAWNTGRLYVFGSDGAIKPGWPRAIGNGINQQGAAYPWGSPLLVDIDGNGTREIFIPGDRWLYGFHHDGTEIRDGDANPATVGPFFDLGGPFNYGSPAGADFDKDGLPEIAVGTRSGQIFLIDGDGTVFPGFPKTFGGGQITGSPAIADLDKDGELEVIFPVRQLLEVHAINRNGQSPPGWPVRININQDLDASPTVADLDGDTFLDVVMSGGTGSISAWHGQNGTLLPGFPRNLALLEQVQSFALRGTPCLGDVTGDGLPDIVVGTQTGSVYGISATGQILPGFPLRAEDTIEGGPLLWDIDGDGMTNIVFGSIDKQVYAYATPGLFNGGAGCPWPMFRHDQANTGFVGTPISVPVEPTLALFQASASAAGVELEWSAGGEEWAGWLVDRSPAADPASTTRLTASPLPHRSGRLRYTDAGALPGVAYLYRLTAVDRAGALHPFAPLGFTRPGAPPARARLSHAPNPFLGATTIFYSLADPGDGAPRPVRLEIFDAQGRRIRRLESAERTPGDYSLAWDGVDDGGRPVEAGLYFYRLTVGRETITNKMTRVR